jgi:hypothetical protein
MVRIQKRTARNNNGKRYRKSVHRGGTVWGQLTSGFSALSQSPELSAATATAQGVFDAAKIELAGEAKKAATNAMASQLVLLCGTLSGGLVELNNQVKSNISTSESEAQTALLVPQNKFTEILSSFCTSFLENFGNVVDGARTILTNNLDSKTRELFNKSLGTIAKKLIRTIEPEKQFTFFVMISLLSDLINPRENRKPLDDATLNAHFDRLIEAQKSPQDGSGRSSRRY